MSKETKSQPKFKKGTMLFSPGYYVDELGKAWWIDPKTREVSPVAPVKYDEKG